MPMQKRSARPLGFTITEMAVVLVIVGLLFVFLIPVSNTLLSNQRRSATLQTLQNIQAALNNFVIVNKRLPCPANGTARYRGLKPLSVASEIARTINNTV